MPIELRLPPRLALAGSVLGNPIRQRAEPMARASFDVERRADGHVLTREDGWSCLVTDRRAPLPADGMVVLFATDAGSLVALAGGDVPGEWLTPLPLDPATLDLDEAQARCGAVLDDLRGLFTFREERRSGDETIEVGLRPPQVGALYAVLAHWKTTDAPATVVMPTGTGKTETMLAVMAWERPTRLLVVVPGDRLREQVGDKFLTMGMLRDLGVLASDAGDPVVGLLRHIPRDAGEVDEVFLRCNVVVTTMSIAGRCPDDAKDRMAEVCSHLLIDEAHHVPARSWSAFRQRFARRPIVQFTATPFRRDGKHVDGRVVFNYPLRKAQAEGYFKPVSFQAVDEVDRGDADREIATVALARLRADLDAGHRHLVMARADDVSRAEGVVGIYRELGPEFEPVVLHHRLAQGDRDRALQRLRAGESRVVVCVDMLGEGFDLPELKIAALGEAPIMLFGHSSYFAWRGRLNTIDDLPMHDVIGFDRGDVILKGFADNGLFATRESFPVRCDDQMVYWNLLLAGAGLGFAQTLLASRYVELEQVPVEMRLPPMPVWLVLHEEVRSNARVRRVADRLSTVLGDLFKTPEMRPTGLPGVLARPKKI